jgi:hypothetical protein
MKRETNNEIDLLLRRMGRGDRDAARAEQTASDDRHLDADELSSYAQNALPAAARARYIEHLAECATCRKLVTELSLSLGAVAVAAPVETVPVPGGFKKFLASLFSPLVLRYAVPALGLFVVMIVGFVVFRQRQPQLARTLNEQVQEPHAITAASPAPAIPDQPATRTPEQVQNRNGKLDDTKPKPGEAPAAGAGAGSSGQATAAKNERAADEQPTPAATPPPAPAKVAEPIDREAPAPATQAAKKLPEDTKEKADAEVAKQRANTNASAGGTVDATRSSNDRVEENKPKATPSETAGFMAGGRVASRRQPESTKRSESKDRDRDNLITLQPGTAREETRTIAGRRFRKERGIWIDTAYDSGTATVNMARDSEQFRALVADEPGIGTIAKQLDGEVIVVWKGRAYRIR